MCMSMRRSVSWETSGGKGLEMLGVIVDPRDVSRETHL
jgi:hypothetical protein